jgi:hypothetical protein
MAERTRDRDQLAFTTLAHRRRPDRELQISRHVARPRLGERDLDPPRLQVCRRRGSLDVPHADDDNCVPHRSPVSRLRELNNVTGTYS